MKHDAGNSSFIDKIKSIDFGIGYGQIGLVNHIAYGNIDEELRCLVSNIETTFGIDDSVSIGDWGGGNGILAKELYQKLDFNHLYISVVDLDSTKFSKGGPIANIEADVVTYKPKIRYDYSLTRNVLHYLDTERQFAFVKNMFRATRFGVLMVNYTYPEQERKQRKVFEKVLKEKTGIVRHFVTRKEVLDIVQRNDWDVKSDATYVWNNFDYEKFYKDRFGLNNDVIGALRSTGLLRTADYQTTVLYCKP